MTAGALLLLLALPACATNSPLTPAQAVAGYAVQLEDLHEDPDTDARTRTALEALHDSLLLPWTLTRGYLIMVSALAWTLTDWTVEGYDPDGFTRRAHQLEELIPSGTAGPPTPSHARTTLHH